MTKKKTNTNIIIIIIIIIIIEGMIGPVVCIYIYIYIGPWTMFENI